MPRPDLAASSAWLRDRLRFAATLSAAVATTWLLPALAVACTVCMGGQEEASRKAFIGTTAFMTFFPLAILFVAVGWFVRRTLEREREDEAAARTEAVEGLAGRVR